MPGSSGLTAARAVATFGPPASSCRYEEYAIPVWRRGANRLANLRTDQSGTRVAPKQR